MPDEESSHFLWPDLEHRVRGQYRVGGLAHGAIRVGGLSHLVWPDLEHCVWIAAAEGINGVESFRLEQLH